MKKESWLSYRFVDEVHPAAYWWRPAIYCNDEVQSRGLWYDDPGPDYGCLPVIAVESIRAYHLLRKREEVRDFEGVVEICYPVPEADPLNKSELCSVVAFGYTQQEIMLGAYVAAQFNGASIYLGSSAVNMLMPAAQVAVFPVIAESTSLFLCAAVAAGCKIVASDAGSTEEYLSRYAQPGTWHVVHNQKQTQYVAAVRSLLNQPNDFNTSMYIDEAPY